MDLGPKQKTHPAFFLETDQALSLITFNKDDVTMIFNN